MDENTCLDLNQQLETTKIQLNQIKLVILCKIITGEMLWDPVKGVIAWEIKFALISGHKSGLCTIITSCKFHFIKSTTKMVCLDIVQCKKKY